MTERLREAEPALVVIAVGSGSDHDGLIGLLSAGIVDRLMLKPVTPSLAQIVLKSAVQQHRTLQGPGTALTLVEPRSIEPECPQPEPAVVLVELQRHAANDLTEVRLASPRLPRSSSPRRWSRRRPLPGASTFRVRPGSQSSPRCSRSLA